MSGNSYTLKVSAEAYDDLIDIQQYTLETFGESQFKKYESLINDAFILIRTNPNIGHHRADIPNNYLGWPVGEHIFIYKVELQIINVVRILHSRMDFRFQFT